MEHQTICENGIVEKYILHQLNYQDVDEFEEHLLFCKECRNELTKLKKVIGLVQHSVLMIKNHETDDELSNSNNQQFEIKQVKLKVWHSFIVKAVAITMLLFGLGSISYFIFIKNKPSQIIEKKGEIASIAVTKNKTKTTTNNSNLKDAVAKNQLEVKARKNKSYEESPIFENAIENTLRSGDLKIISPVNSVKIQIGETLIFNWKGDYLSLNLSLLNNKEKIIFEKQIQSPYQLPLKLEKGLYYWKLEDQDEIVYIGKFYIN